MVGADELLDVGAALGRVALVVQVDELDLASEDAARLVHVAGPQVVATLESLAVGGEVAGQRDRHTDGDRLLVARARATAAAASRAAGGKNCHGRRPGSGDWQEPGSVTSHSPAPPSFDSNKGKRDASAATAILRSRGGKAGWRVVGAGSRYCICVVAVGFV